MNNFKCPCCRKVFSAMDGIVVLCPHCNTVVMLPEEKLESGDVVGGFQIEKFLGKGGMGNVYLSKQISMQRLVALKIIPKNLVNDPNMIEQFRNEVQVSGRLNHPNIITAIDSGETEKYYFLAVTYIDGEDYEKRMNREFTVPEKEAFDMSLKIAEALNYAWEKHKLMHKDIKPGNLMRDKKGEVFIMDMGIAQKIGARTDRMDYVLGSPFYISPEQVQAHPLDWRCDLYSLGATLFHMIVGVPPYDADDVTGIVKKHVFETFPDPFKLNPNTKISKGAVRILKKMMTKKPEDRFSSWEEYQKAVKNRQSRSTTTTTILKRPTPTPPSPSLRDKSAKIATPGGKTVSASKAPKQTHFAIILLNYILMLAVAVIACFLIRNFMNSSNAHKFVKMADDYSLRHPDEYSEIRNLFEKAKDISKGTKYEKYAADKYALALDSENKWLAENAKFDEGLKKVSAHLRDKEFDKALEILNELKGIKDPSKKYQIEMIIKQIPQQ